jgi:hypothetical protein
LRSVDKFGQHWIRLALSSGEGASPVPREEWQRFRAPEEFRRDVASIVKPGTTIIVTPDSLASTSADTALPVMESEPGSH